MQLTLSSVTTAKMSVRTTPDLYHKLAKSTILFHTKTDKTTILIGWNIQRAINITTYWNCIPLITLFLKMSFFTCLKVENSGHRLAVIPVVPLPKNYFPRPETAMYIMVKVSREFWHSLGLPRYPTGYRNSNISTHLMAPFRTVPSCSPSSHEAFCSRGKICLWKAYWTHVVVVL